MSAAPDLQLVVGRELNRLAGARHRLGVALSGGGDSMALLHLAHGWAGGGLAASCHLRAATVDHGLRAESAEEADFAGASARRLGIAHEVLHWTRDTPRGNLMAAAREARLRLLSDWARRHDLDAVLLGHTMEDQAETVLMRLARGAGVDGLSGMADRRSAHGMIWLRPLLGQRRADLRDWLRARGIAWVDDPSNENPDYERVHIRKAMALLGLSPEGMARTAADLSLARHALQEFAARVCQGADATRGQLGLPLREFSDAPEEIQRRILVAGLRWMTGAAYPPRRDRIANALAAIGAGRACTTDGVLLRCRAERILLIREPAAACRAPAAHPDEQGRADWDGRWRVTGLSPGDRVRAVTALQLGGLDWRGSGLSHAGAAASPAIWRDGRLIAAPALQPDARFSALPLREMEHFRAMLFSH